MEIAATFSASPSIASTTMPAKRRAQAAAQAESSAAPKARQSKLAKEHNITGAEENEIKEAFALFSTPKSGEKEGVIPIGDVRRAMIALGIPPSPEELAEFVSILDPDEEGFERTSDSHNDELEEAFRLFTNGVRGPDGREGKITLATLKRVAAALREDVDGDLLRDMILEANGGAGVGRGVEKDEFEGVMRRAGVWR